MDLFKDMMNNVLVVEIDQIHGKLHFEIKLYWRTITEKNITSNTAGLCERKSLPLTAGLYV
jgi:hypothetical protein